MIYLFLILSSVGIGWFVRDMTLAAIRKIAQRHQNLRLDNIVKQKRAIPFQSFIYTFRENASGLFKGAAFKNYLGYIETLLRRSNYSYVKPEDILGYQVLLALGCTLVFGLLAGSMELGVISFGVGAALPLIWLNDKAQKREKDLLRELPNALEVLSLCSEAGLSLEQAMDQYLKNAKAGPLKDEFSKIMEQTRTGSGRKTAFTSVTEK